MLGWISRIIAFLLPFALLAQQDPQFGQYMMNPQMWNPSQAALSNHVLASFHHRSQWLGYTTSLSADQINPPSTQLFTLAVPIPSIRSGVGLELMNDNIGPLRNFNARLTYAYARSLGPGQLAAGVGLGVQSINLNTSLWRPENANDPTLTTIGSGTVSQTKPSLRVGIGYSTDQLYVGFAINQVYAPPYSFAQSIQSRLVKHYYLQGSYKIYLSEGLSLQPTFIWKSLLATNSLEVDNLFLFGKLWAGIGFRTKDAAVFLAGISLLSDNSLKIGYNLDLSVINTEAKSLTSHEIFLSYNLGSILDNRKPIVRSPRFRY